MRLTLPKPAEEEQEQDQDHRTPTSAMRILLLLLSCNPPPNCRNFPSAAPRHLRRTLQLPPSPQHPTRQLLPSSDPLQPLARSPLPGRWKNQNPHRKAPTRSAFERTPPTTNRMRTPVGTAHPTTPRS